MKRLNTKAMKKISEISTKYKFRDFFELEQDEIYNFCNAFLQCVVLGLNAESEDVEFITKIRDTLAGDI